MAKGGARPYRPERVAVVARVRIETAVVRYRGESPAGPGRAIKVVDSIGAIQATDGADWTLQPIDAAERMISLGSVPALPDGRAHGAEAADVAIADALRRIEIGFLVADAATDMTDVQVPNSVLDPKGSPLGAIRTATAWILALNEFAGGMFMASPTLTTARRKKRVKPPE